VSSINRVVLTGRLVRDPELRTTQTGKQVVGISIAVQKRIKPQDPNERDAFFFRVTAWGQTAEFIANYATKGRLVGVDGRLEQRRYTGNDGIEREVYEVVAENVTLLDRPRDDSSSETAAVAIASEPVEVPMEDFDPFEEE
jgi:single-strand DNA-binding protein